MNISAEQYQVLRDAEEEDMYTTYVEESTVHILTFGSKPVGVYSTPELALDARDRFIETVDKHHDKTWIDIMFDVVPMQLDMPVDITRIRPN